MRITKTSLAVGAIALFGFISASAAVTISGEAKAHSSPVSHLHLSINASGGDVAASGSAQYTRMTEEGSPELELDMPVSCMWVSDDAQRVVMAGPATVTSNPKSAGIGEWFVIALQKKPAEKERVRALFATQREAAEMCEVGETVFPAIVDSGGFAISQDETTQSNPPADATGSDASRCVAHYRFNGDLTDGSGNGHDALMVDVSGLPTGSPALFDAGKLGQALHLTGDSVAVAPLDLHFEACPKITMTAWVKLPSKPAKAQTLVSTGYGSGPRLAVSDSRMSAWGGSNEIRSQSRLWTPPLGEWFSVVAVWDYEAGTHTLYVDDSKVTEQLGNYSRPPQQDLWIGAYAYNTKLQSIAEGMLIDDLRVFDRILDDNQITAALEDQLSVGSDCNCGETPQPQRPLSAQLPAPGNGLGDPEFPAPVAGVEPPGVTPTINPEDVPVSPTDMLPDGTSPGLIPAPEGFGAGGSEPTLSLPEDTPGQELQDDIDAAENSTPIVAGPTDEFECEGRRNPMGRAAIAGTFPSDFTNALTQAQDCAFSIKVAAINNSGQWIISSQNHIAYSDSVPDSLAGALDRFEHEHGGLDAADISNNGAWLIVSGNDYEQHGLPSDAVSKVRNALGLSRQVVSFSFHPSDPSRWLLVDGSGTVSGRNMGRTMLDELEDLAYSKRVVHAARYSPDGSWVLLGNDRWFATSGVAVNLIATMDSIRRQGRDIGHVLFFNSQANNMVVTNGPQRSRPGDPIWRVERGFATANIWQSLKDYNLTGVSIAMIRNNNVEWARGYGLRVAGNHESYVHADTVFDVASISKPVASFGVLQLVDAGKLSLTEEGVLENIEQLISSFNRPSFRRAVRPEASNLAQVLQHCASICYTGTASCANGGSAGGAAQYSPTTSLPSLTQMIRGTGAASASHALVRTGNPGVRTEYTSANYMLVQALIEIHGNGYLNHMERLLNDLGMASATYRSPFSGWNTDRFARGHEGSRTMPVYAYGEMAAASMTATPTDLAKFVIALNRDGQGLLSEPLLDQFLGRKPARTNSRFPDPDFTIAEEYCGNATNETMKLGIRHADSDSNWGGNEVFWHGGSHNGYRTRMIGLPELNSGLVVFMTGSSAGTTAFYTELRRSVVAAYGL